MFMEVKRQPRTKINLLLIRFIQVLEVIKDQEYRQLNLDQVQQKDLKLIKTLTHFIQELLQEETLLITE